MTPFDIIKTISTRKKITEWDQEVEKEYMPWVINNAYSMGIQTVFFANEMNLNSFLDKKIQYDFYFGIIPKGTRAGAWVKKEEQNKDVQAIIDYYLINIDRALEYARILSPEQIKEITLRLQLGGRK